MKFKLTFLFLFCFIPFTKGAQNWELGQENLIVLLARNENGLNAKLAHHYFHEFEFSENTYPDSLRKTHSLEMNNKDGKEILVEMNSFQAPNIILLFYRTSWLGWKCCGVLLPNDQTDSTAVHIHREMKLLSRIEYFPCNCCILKKTVFWRMEKDTLMEYCSVPYHLESYCNRNLQSDLNVLSYNCSYSIFHQDSLQIEYFVTDVNNKGEAKRFSEFYALQINSKKIERIYHKESNTWRRVDDLPLWNITSPKGWP